VTKKDNKKVRRRRDAVATDWQALFVAVKDVIDWALDIAVQLSRDLPEDVEAIEAVRTCFHAWLAGHPCVIDVDDLLITFASILSKVERDLGMSTNEILTPVQQLADIYDGRHAPVITIRRGTRRRNAASSGLAA
jgi:hypothetical protein